MQWVQRAVTGFIIAAGNTPSKPSGSDIFEVTGSATENVNLITNYFHDGIDLLPKQHFTLVNVPVPATAIIEGVKYPITENPVSFEFDAPGTYTVTIDAGPAYYVEEFTFDYQP